jgi:hypothetical protein
MELVAVLVRDAPINKSDATLRGGDDQLFRLVRPPPGKFPGSSAELAERV